MKLEQSWRDTRASDLPKSKVPTWRQGLHVLDNRPTSQEVHGKSVHGLTGAIPLQARATAARQLLVDADGQGSLVAPLTASTSTNTNTSSTESLQPTPAGEQRGEAPGGASGVSLSSGALRQMPLN